MKLQAVRERQTVDTLIDMKAACVKVTSNMVHMCSNALWCNDALAAANGQHKSRKCQQRVQHLAGGRCVANAC
jgi:hypothetical protein